MYSIKSETTLPFSIKIKSIDSLRFGVAFLSRLGFCNSCNCRVNNIWIKFWNTIEYLFDYWWLLIIQIIIILYYAQQCCSLYPEQEVRIINIRKIVHTSLVMCPLPTYAYPIMRKCARTHLNLLKLFKNNTLWSSICKKP